MVNLNTKDFDKVIMVGDRVLIKPKSPLEKTKSGLILPPTAQEKEKLAMGYVIKVGPGYPIPVINEDDEPWKDKSDQVKYVPLQPKVGDLAVFLQKSAYEVNFDDEQYLIVPHSAIVMLVRDEELFT